MWDTNGHECGTRINTNGGHCTQWLSFVLIRVPHSCKFVFQIRFMKKSGLALLLAISLFACRDNNAPDVSNIKVDVQVKRFEQDFFALDTINFMSSLNELGTKYPVFLGDFLFNIMYLPPITDTSLAIQALLKQYIIDYKPLKDSADKAFADFDGIVDDILKGLQYVKYYLPDYGLTVNIITYIGPIEGN